MLKVYILICTAIFQLSQQFETRHFHENRDPRVPLRTIKCMECYETPITKGSTCSKTRFCEGKWCVKGPDQGGVYRGCMHVLPFSSQVARCYNITGEEGQIYENCYCNSHDFCNSSNQLSTVSSFILLIVPLSLLLLSILP